jgi:hypothetical protein
MAEKKEDPLAQFEDEEIIKSLEARPMLLELLKKKFTGEVEPAPEGEEAIAEDEEEADIPTNIIGTY